jgi:GT2 family glycosyltransferase
MEPPAISVVIVNWNSLAFLRNCLRSIYNVVKEISFEVIVVDNASYDGSAEMCNREFSDVVFVQSDQNLGFSKGNNKGVSVARADTLLFLNPDTELLDDALKQMYVHLHASSSLGAVGCRILNTDFSLQLAYIQAFPTIVNQTLGTDLLIRLFPKSSHWGFAAMLSGNENPVPVEVIAGSCIMVKREVFDKVGGFDEEFPMYAEDVALCYMIRKAGFEIEYRGVGSVVHHCGKSSSAAKENHFSALMQRQSMALFFRKTRGPLYVRLFNLTTAACALVRFACFPILYAVQKSVAKRSAVSLMCRRWWKLFKWSFGTESVSMPKTGKEPRETAPDQVCVN